MKCLVRGHFCRCVARPASAPRPAARAPAPTWDPPAASDTPVRPRSGGSDRLAQAGDEACHSDLVGHPYGRDDGRAFDEPWLITQTPSTPSSIAPPMASGSNSAARGASRGSMTSAAALASSSAENTPSSVSMKNRRDPSRVLSATLPVNPSVTTTSAVQAQEVTTLDVAHEAHAPAPRPTTRASP